MFLNLDKHNQTKIAIKDDSGYSLTYSEVCNTGFFTEIKNGWYYIRSRRQEHCRTN